MGKAFTVKDAQKIAHTLSNPAKMPCKGYSLPAAACKTGSKLRAKSGTVCSDCYACKGCYQFPVVQDALQKRLDSIVHENWVKALVKMIGRSEFFRWHDSGDIQSLEHLQKIFDVCEQTPNTRHWLPTKEKGLLRKAYAAKMLLPENLVIRYSMPMIDQKPNDMGTIKTSHSVSSAGMADGHLCKAYENDGACGDCRACWNSSIDNIAYLMH